MEEILSLIVGSLIALFPILFMLSSRRRMMERKKRGSGGGSGPEPGPGLKPRPGSGQAPGQNASPGRGQSQGQERENYDHPESIVARIMRSQGIRQIAGDAAPGRGETPGPEVTPGLGVAPGPWVPPGQEAVNPQVTEWKPEPKPKPKPQWWKKGVEEEQSTAADSGMETPDSLGGRRRIEALPKLQQAVVWAEVLGKPKGY